MIKIYTDGASRGNPGESAFAFIFTEKGKVIFLSAEYIGSATNNIAEYMAIISALREAGEKNIDRASLISDSELVISQINGTYKTKATLKNYQKIEEKITEKFNIIFLDSPFPSLLAGKVVEMLSNFPLLKNDSIIIAEHSTSEKLPQEIVGKNTLKKIKEKKYGKIAVTYYKVLAQESNNAEK